MKIINKTDLSYEMIGIIIDDIIEKSVGSTHYVGQIEYTTCNVACREIRVQIRYLKKYVEWRFSYGK